MLLIPSFGLRTFSVPGAVNSSYFKLIINLIIVNHSLNLVLVESFARVIRAGGFAKTEFRFGKSAEFP